MTVGILLLVIHDVVEKLVGLNLLKMDGEFGEFELHSDFDVIRVVSECLRNRGVKIDEDVMKIIEILPTIIQLIGK